ncbi:hypothetical protein [Blastococcus sp. SYSU DS0533]
MRLLVLGGAQFLGRHVVSAALARGHDVATSTRGVSGPAAAALGGVHGYAYASSLNAYRSWPPGPVGREDGEPAWDTEDDGYGPSKAYAERAIGASTGPGCPPHGPGWSSARTTTCTGWAVGGPGCPPRLAGSARAPAAGPCSGGCA